MDCDVLSNYYESVIYHLVDNEATESSFFNDEQSNLDFMKHN